MGIGVQPCCCSGAPRDLTCAGCCGSGSNQASETAVVHWPGGVGSDTLTGCDLCSYAAAGDFDLPHDPFTNPPTGSGCVFDEEIPAGGESPLAGGGSCAASISAVTPGSWSTGAFFLELDLEFDSGRNQCRLRLVATIEAFYFFNSNKIDFYFGQAVYFGPWGATGANCNTRTTLTVSTTAADYPDGPFPSYPYLGYCSGSWPGTVDVNT